MGQKKNIVPMSSPDLNASDIEAVLSTLKTNYLSIGPKINIFEDMFSKFTGAKHAIGVNSGTAGLHLCIRATGIKQGDYVITTPFSFVSSSNVILFEKAIPVFVDVDLQTGNIDAEQVAQAVEDIQSGNAKRARRWMPRQGAGEKGHLKTILPVDVFGQPADYRKLQEVAANHSLTLIEDSCEALGAMYEGKHAGMLGNFGVFAFYPNKQITTGEGGMIVTDNDQFAERMRALRNQGRAPGDTWLQHTYLGYNYRLDEMSAALGISQMKRVEQLLKKRQQVADWYNAKLNTIKGIETPYITPATTRMSWFVYVIRLDPSLDRDRVAEMLLDSGIPVRPYFLPIHLQPYIAEQFGYREGDYPVTEDLGRRSLAVPFSGIMTEAQVDLVCEVIEKTLLKF